MNGSPRTSIPQVDVDRWSDIAEEARSSAVPLVVRGACAGIVGSWSPRRFADLWPDKSVAFVTDLPAHGVPYRESADKHQVTGTLRAFVDQLEAGGQSYLNQVPLSTFPELEQSFDLKPLRLGRVFAVNVWIGGRTRSGLHFDHADNLFVQVHGRKWAVLVSPEDSRHLYPFSDNPSKSQIDPEAPDLVRHPAFGRCRQWFTDLAPGDALYIPRGWWHFLGADGISVSINCWHGDSLSELERTRMFLAGGARVLARTAFDFVWSGILARPYEARMFSPPPPGVQAYRRMRRRLHI